MKTTYHYLVAIHATTFENDANRTTPFSHHEIFKAEDLMIARKDALAFYEEQLRGLPTASYVLPFSPPEHFERGKNSAISIDLYLVEEHGEYEYFHSLSDSDEIEETLEIERSVFAELGPLL